MNVREAQKSFSFRCWGGVFAILILASYPARAQTKKTSAPAAKPATPAKPAAAPSKSGGGSTGGGTHTGPTTASHGPTTASPHGPTTTTTHATTTNTRPSTTTSRPTAASRPSTATSRPSVVGGHVVPASSRVTHTPNGAEVRTRANGRVADVHVANRAGGNMDIHHGLNGNRRVEVERADHSRIVAERGGHGYVQHPYTYQGHAFAERTYVYNGSVYNNYYGGYYYRGVYVNYYAPGYYYSPYYYGWAYNPWAAPVSYAWGWGGNPWVGYYGAYFTPYPVYASASLWLTDYMISTTLASAYQAQVEANQVAQQQAAADAAALTAQTKDLIAAEVQRQVALEGQEAQTAQTAVPNPASSSIQRMLTDGVQHIFLAGSDLDLVDDGGTECAISQGDAMQLAGPPPADSTVASVTVLSNKGGQECGKGVTVSVAITDLQEMQNRMRETIDKGMGDLKAKQGTGGLPSIPSSANAAPVKASFASVAPPPDPNAATEIKQQVQEADQAEAQATGQAPPDNMSVKSASPGDAPASTAPVSISLGQSIDEVTKALGQPKNIVDLGSKKMYVYNDMKITFKAGKVSDVQ